MSAWCCLPIIATPFHCAINRCHHCRSDLKAALSRRKRCPRLAPLSNSNIRLRNVLPGRMTLVACCNFPTRDSSSLAMQDLLPSHSATNILSSARSLRDISLVLSSIPNPTLFLGPPASQAPLGLSAVRKSVAVSSAGHPDSLPSSLLSTGSHPSSASRTPPLPVSLAIREHPPIPRIFLGRSAN